MTAAQAEQAGNDERWCRPAASLAFAERLVVALHPKAYALTSAERALARRLYASILSRLAAESAEGGRIDPVECDGDAGSDE